MTHVHLSPTITAIIVWDGTYRAPDGWGHSKGLLLANEGGNVFPTEQPTEQPNPRTTALPRRSPHDPR